MSVQNGHLWRSGGLWCSSLHAIYRWLAARFFGPAGTIGMHFDARTVEAQTINGHADHVVLLKNIKQSVQNARVGPTAYPGVNRVPLAETWLQGPPFAAVLGDKEDGVDHG